MATGGNAQQSSEQATKSGISALESAQQSIQSSKSGVDSTRSTLSQGYQGSDGAQFGQLLAQWDQQCQIILKNLSDMITQLNHTATEHRKTQGNTNDSISNAHSKSASAFDTLTSA
jgi:uncharacterized protein YukE